MIYEQTSSVSGNWIKSGEVVSGTKAKIKSETKPIPGQFQNKDGSPKNQDVAKVMLQGSTEPVNVAFNRATISALIESYGNDSKNWIDKLLTVQAEKMIVGGKRVTALYFLPEGYEVGEDEGGYMVIRKVGGFKSGLTEEDKATISSARTAEQNYNNLDNKVSDDLIPF